MVLYMVLHNNINMHGIYAAVMGKSSAVVNKVFSAGWGVLGLYGRDCL